MLIIEQISEFIFFNIRAVYCGRYKAFKKKTKKQKKNYQNLSTVTPKVAENLLSYQESKYEDPYKIVLFLEVIYDAC